MPCFFPAGSHHRRSLLSSAASRDNTSQGLSGTRGEDLSAGATAEDPELERKNGRGSKYMPLNVEETNELSPPAVNAGNVLGRLLDHKLRGQQPAERGGAKQGESRGGVSEAKSGHQDEPEAGAEEALPVISPTDSKGQSALLDAKGGDGAASNDREGSKAVTLLEKTRKVSPNVSGPAAHNASLPHQGVLSKLSSFLAGSPKVRQIGGSQANVSSVVGTGVHNRTAHNQTAQTKPSLVLHNLRNARARVREGAESELRLIEEAKRALGEPDPARGAESGVTSGGQNDDILESAEDRWDLMRIEAKLSAEQEYAEYIGKLEDEKARAEAAEAARLKAEADGAAKSEEADEQNGSADERNGSADERNQVAEERNGKQAEAEGAGKAEDAEDQTKIANEGNEIAGERNEPVSEERKEPVAEQRNEAAEEGNEGGEGEDVANKGAEEVESVNGDKDEESAEAEAERVEEETVEVSGAKLGGEMKTEDMATEERSDEGQKSVDTTTGEASKARGEAKGEGTWEAGSEAAVESENPKGAEGDSADTPLERDASEAGEGKAAE